MPVELVGEVPSWAADPPGEVDGFDGGEACGMSAGEGIAVPTACCGETPALLMA